MMSQNFDEPGQDGVLQEYRFEAQTPLIGPLIARFRAGWHSIAGKWALRFIAQQQSAINLKQQVINVKQQAINQRVKIELDEAQAGLALSDHDLMDLTRTVAELTQQVIQLRQAVVELEQRQATARNQADD